MSFIYSLLLGLVFLLNEILTLQFLLFKSKKKSPLGRQNASCYEYSWPWVVVPLNPTGRCSSCIIVRIPIVASSSLC